jgi:predicted TPR repeat methyltransferase
MALARAKRHLIGVDLSEKMVTLSRARGVYDELFVAEVHDWLRMADAARFDVVIAADVFIYVGALETMFAEIARVLRPGGWLAFSTEECAEGTFALQPSGRYAQSEAYIRELAQPAFVVREAEPSVLRLEGTTPTLGRLYLLQRS